MSLPEKHFLPANSDAWRTWLEQHHETEDFVWLVFYRKSSPLANLSWSEAVDEALCFGWIDSTKKTIDNECYIQYFGKRKATSTWSKINKDKVDHLIKHGRMSTAGMKTIRAAKENGMWTLLDDVEELIIPDDLEKAFAAYPKSKAHFQGLSKSIQKGMLAWVVLAKRPETRAKRIREIAETTGRESRPKQFL